MQWKQVYIRRAMMLVYDWRGVGAIRQELGLNKMARQVAAVHLDQLELE